MIKKSKKQKVNKEAKGNGNKEKINNKLKLKSDVKRGVVVVLLCLMAILFTFGFFGVGGTLGIFLNKLAGLVFGWGKWLFPIALLLASGILLRRKSTTFYTVKIIGLVILFLSVLGFFHIFFVQSDFLKIAKSGEGGGYIGYLEATLLIKFTGKVASLVVLLAFSIIGIMVAFNFSVLEFFTKFFEKGKDKESKDDKKDDDKDDNKDDNNGYDDDEQKKREINSVAEGFNEGKDTNGLSEDTDLKNNIKNVEFAEGPNRVDDAKSENYSKNEQSGFLKKNVIQKKKKKPFKIINKKNLDEWELPPLDLLDSPKNGEILSGNIKKNKEIIQDTFANFGIELNDGGVKIGPTVTQYSFRPAVGVKLSKIMALGDNLALALAVHPIRIEAPIPGKSLIGIEVPNEKGEVIKLRKILESDIFQDKKGGLILALGEDVEGEYMIADLGLMPHLLVAGATGTGKSVCINSIILSLLFQNSPEDLKMILIDPKRVELSLYNKIPHLLSDVIVDKKKVVNALRWAIREMEDRYKILQSVGSRDLESYAVKLARGVKRKYIDEDTGDRVEEDLKKLPLIVIVIDELSDLMASHGKDIEGLIVRLSQMARAVGIHLIISTQRPSVKIITGLIKANITARIALQVATQIDSRTIIDMSGAEKLLGKGDMLFLSADFLKPKRVQSSFVTESEVKRVVEFIKNQYSMRKKSEKNDKEDVGQKKNKEDIDFEEKQVDPSQQINFSQLQDEDEKDELYEEVKDLIINFDRASASLLQRRFKIGYNRAARIIDSLEKAGIVGPADGQKAREVLVKSSISSKEKAGTTYENEEKDQIQRDKWQI